MTTLRGQGRITVSPASKIMATIAANRAVRYGRKRGRKHFQSRKERLGFLAPSLRGDRLNKAHLVRQRVRGLMRKRECSATLVDGEQAAVGSRYVREALQEVIGAVALQNFGLVIYARIAIFDVERVSRDQGARLFKANGHQQTLGAAVAGAKSKIADTEENWAASIDLKRLDDVGVMTDHRVRAQVDCQAGFGAVFGRGLPNIGNAPMENGHNSIRATAQRANVCLKGFGGVHGAAR